MEGLTLLSVGKSAPHVDGIDSVHAGSVHDDRLLSLIYSCADLFVTPGLNRTTFIENLEHMVYP